MCILLLFCFQTGKMRVKWSGAKYGIATKGRTELELFLTVSRCLQKRNNELKLNTILHWLDWRNS